RGDFNGFVLTYLWNQWRKTKADWIDIFGPEARRHFESTVRSERSFKRAVAGMWPVMSGREFVSNLLASPSMLHGAADGSLSDAEQQSLLRAADHPPSDADAALIDEAE